MQWLGVGAFTAGGPGSIPGRGTKIPTSCMAKKRKGLEECDELMGSSFNFLSVYLTFLGGGRVGVTKTRDFSTV